MGLIYTFGGSDVGIDIHGLVRKFISIDGNVWSSNFAFGFVLMIRFIEHMLELGS